MTFDHHVQDHIEENLFQSYDAEDFVDTDATAWLQSQLGQDPCGLIGELHDELSELRSFNTTR